MGHVILKPRTRRWGCPSCGVLHETREARAHVPMHSCVALQGCSVPFVEIFGNKNEVGGGVRHVVKEREDYIGDEIVTRDAAGRPVMAVLTERADGSNDCHAFAGTAQAFAN